MAVKRLKEMNRILAPDEGAADRFGKAAVISGGESRGGNDSQYNMEGIWEASNVSMWKKRSLLR